MGAGDTTTLKDGLDQDKVENPAGDTGGTVESPMDIANGLPSFLVDIYIQG